MQKKGIRLKRKIVQIMQKRVFVGSDIKSSTHYARPAKYIQSTSK